MLTEVFLCLIWFSLSSLNNVIGKTILNAWPRPLTVTLVQLMSIYFYLKPVLYFRRISVPKIRSRTQFTYVLPLSTAKFLASSSAHFSLTSVSLSYSHTVKSLMPFFVVVLSRILLGERHSKKVYMSLLPVVGGVFISTLNELNLSGGGLLSAIFSTTVFSLMSIFSKRFLNLTQMSPLALLSILSGYALLMFIPFWCLLDIRVNYYRNDENLIAFNIFLLLLCDGLLCFLQNVVAFILIGRLTALSYSVANVAKRVCVISLSIFVFRNPVNIYNGFGMLIAIAGLLCYNHVKHQERKQITHLNKLKLQQQEKQGLNSSNHFNNNHRLNGMKSDENLLLSISIS